jgi:hypothetical protein
LEFQLDLVDLEFMQDLLCPGGIGSGAQRLLSFRQGGDELTSGPLVIVFRHEASPLKK